MTETGEDIRDALPQRPVFKTGATSTRSPAVAARKPTYGDSPQLELTRFGGLTILREQGELLAPDLDHRRDPDLLPRRAGRLEVRREGADVAGIAREVTRVLSPVAERSQVDLHFECEGAHPALWTDPGKIRQILLNLIGTAARYTQQGQITVTVDCDRPVAGDFRIHVRDTGPGIALEDQERIFEPFTQVDFSHTRAVGGTGLGLSISRKLARLLGGDITLQSAPGEGSTFTLHLPIGGEEAR